MKVILLARMEKIKHAYRTFKARPTDPETTHKLRVNIRKLRGLLNFLKPVIDQNIYEAINRVLREINQSFSGLRECDVLLELCQELVDEHSELDEEAEPLFQFLNNERRKEMVRLLQQDSRPNLKAVENALHQISLPDKNWDKFVSKRIEKKAEVLKKEYHDLNNKSYEKIHKVRIMAKKLRYAAEYFDALTTKELEKYATYAEKIQDKLGKKTDHYVNQRLLIRYGNQVQNSELKTVFEKMRELNE